MEIVIREFPEPGVGSTMTNCQQVILEEADRINESVELSSVQHFIAAKYWRNTHFIMGITATILAATSTTLIFFRGDLIWPGLLSVAVAIISGLITFLNPRHHADIHHRKGVDYQQVGAKMRMLSKIDCLMAEDERDLVSTLKSLSEQKFDLDRQTPATPSGIFYRQAKRSIEGGETGFRVDAR